MSGAPDSVDFNPEEQFTDPRPRHTPLWALLSSVLLAVEAWLRSHGGNPLQYSIRAFWTLVAAAGVFLLVGPVINKPLTLEDITGSASTATQQWIARSFAADYTIDRAADGTMKVQVEERIEALFPEDVEERSIRRVLATNYQGNDLNPGDVRATLNGDPIEVQQDASPNQLALTLEADEILRGDHVFVLTYTLEHLAYESVDEASGQPVDLLEWDVFGPSWGTAFGGLEVNLTLPEDLAEQLIRSPRGSIAWTLLGAGAWLTPEEDSPPGFATYTITNDQNIPPHAQVRFTLPFESGTFTMPPKSTMWWVQTYGPIAPLAFLAVTFLFALAARAVAWSDERGRPWFVMQSSPPRDVSPRLAAQVLKTPRTMELAEALSGGDAAKIGRVARRAGRWGDLPRAWRRFLSARERKQQFERGLRRIPRGFVRDLFIAAPLALTLVQWGLVRQLSYQVKLSVVWWPTAFVLVSTAIAVVVLGITFSAKPLTRDGALLRQHLLGVGMYAERTNLADRTTLKDRLLPYAVLLDRPRNAGRRVTAMAERQRGGDGFVAGEDDPSFLTRPRMLVRLLAVAIVAASIGFVALTPTPYGYENDHVMFSWDVPGSSATSIRAFTADAELTRTPEGNARLDVTQRVTVEFDDRGSRVPQFVQEWPSTSDGHELGFTIDRVLVGGRAVPYSVERHGETTALVTRMVDVLSGEHEVLIDYSVTTAARAAETVDGALVDRVQWAALLDGWAYNSTWDPQEALDPFEISLRMSDELASEATASGWATLDTTTSDRADGWKESLVPFGDIADAVERETTEPGPHGVTTESSARDGDATLHTLQLRTNEHGSHLFALRLTDLGVIVDFPAGTFAEADESALRRAQAAPIIPIMIAVGLAVLAVGLATLAFIPGVRLRARTRGTLRDTVRWVTSATAVATLVLFFWAVAEMAGDDNRFIPIGLSVLAALTAAIVTLVVTRRRKDAVRS